ncbi:MAG: DUF1573 domain-containing protein [Candidatus Azambacteria bacterium]|nr:DUF1573 domain-containing protein [Candidatus Azambacteria bacterium]
MENKNNVIVWSTVILIIIIAFVWISRRSSENQTPRASLTRPSAFSATESFFDFEKISMAKGNVSHDFSIKNSGSKPINITKVYTSCMCTTAILRMSSGKELGPYGMPGHGGFAPAINQTIMPGEEVTVKTVFDPAAHGPAGVGLIERAVYIENDFGKPVVFQFKAVVTP